MLIECEPMAALPDGANMGDLLAADVELAGQYRECAARHRGLVEWARRLGTGAR